MNSGICMNTIIPVRKNPDHRSEMVSQLLFGELYDILDKEKSWNYIRCRWDGYEGWITSGETSVISEEQTGKLESSETFCTWQPVTEIHELNSRNILHITCGSNLYHVAGNLFSMAGHSFKINGLAEKKSYPDVRSAIVDHALRLTGSAYLWGGRSPFGIDCSGFTQVVFKIAGIRLPRDASQQVNTGETVHFLHDALPGDLAFFENEAGHISHTGIILGDSKIIHASGKVRIDHLDHQGIFNSETRQYTHVLRTVKRVV
jgi:cell wall-associated NlpC family hydrolase